MSEKRPANPSDFNIHPADDNIVTNIILDGKIMEKNLSELGYDKLWLMNTLQKQGITKIDNIFLATYNSTDQSLSAYLTNKNLWYHLQKSDGPPSFFYFKRGRSCFFLLPTWTILLLLFITSSKNPLFFIISRTVPKIISKISKTACPFYVNYWLYFHFIV